LEDKALTGRLRQNAREYAERHLRMADYLDQYCQLIARLTGENPAPSQDAGPISIAPLTKRAPASKPIRRLVTADA
jgi:hypothetical protein